MLVITRCPDEKFFIDAPGNPRITVKLLRIKGGSARLGVDADRSIRIIREELAGEPSKHFIPDEEGVVS